MKENPERVAERELVDRVRKNMRSRTTGAVGAASEMIVCADLLMKGWHVFRSVSPHCPCDLIVMRGPVMLQVEVRTAMNKHGQVLRCDDHGKYDILAIVRGMFISYRPELPEVVL